MSITKSYDIPKQLVMQAYRLIKANKGAEGVDGESLTDFEKDLKNNLYKIWNRMSSGSYFPPSVKAVPIKKKSGGYRVLGIPTVSDRIAQMVVKLVFEPEVEKYFLPDSYGYRPNKSALDAIGVTRKRCWEYDWVLEFDIKALFDNLSHDLLMKAVHKHTQNKWVLLYIERWLTASMQQEDGTLTMRTCGVPQGGVISPVLSNLFLHYVFDKWMQRNYSNRPWCRYADDGLIHCKTEAEAHKLLSEVAERFAECGLTLHPDKTQIVYCKDGQRKKKYPNTSFDFLGYTFRCRCVNSGKHNSVFASFTPAVSNEAVKSMRAKTRQLNWRNRTELSLGDIAKECNPILSGWLHYYGRYHRSQMQEVWRHFNKTLVAWVMRKYKRYHGRKALAIQFMVRITKQYPNMFAHWKAGMVSGFT